tara:strand:+ start:1507 stop:1974 length:468 start_codon:yes stop_codon:yes gene_type:complete
MSDMTRLLVAYTNESDTCRTPHFTSDLIVALKDDDVSLTRLSFTNGYEATFVINGFPVTVRGVGVRGIFSVSFVNRFVLAKCARTALVPVSVSGASILTMFIDKYGTGSRLDDLDDALKEFSLTSGDVHWETVSYLEASLIVEAIHMLIPASSVA